MSGRISRELFSQSHRLFSSNLRCYGNSDNDETGLLSCLELSSFKSLIEPPNASLRLVLFVCNAGYLTQILVRYCGTGSASMCIQYPYPCTIHNIAERFMRVGGKQELTTSVNARQFVESDTAKFVGESV